MSTDISVVRVLVVDDHPLFRFSVIRAIESDDRLEVAGEAEDGEQALAAIRTLRPDVAVVDLRLPKLDGLQITKAVRAESLATRIVLLSGHLRADDAYEALGNGASGLLSKTAEAGSVTAAILAVARGETVIAPELQEVVAGAIQSRSGEPMPSLTPRERDVLVGVADGASVATIAERLGVRPATVKTHLDHLYRKLGVDERAAAVAEGMRRGILE
jgi:two-component system nitrate/nitrite response regulator NarL